MGIILLEFVKFNGKKCPPRQSDHLLVKLEFDFFSLKLLWEGIRLWESSCSNLLSLMERNAPHGSRTICLSN